MKRSSGLFFSLLFVCLAAGAAHAERIFLDGIDDPFIPFGGEYYTVSTTASGFQIAPSTDPTFSSYVTHFGPREIVRDIGASDFSFSITLDPASEALAEEDNAGPYQNGNFGMTFRFSDGERITIGWGPSRPVALGGIGPAQTSIAFDSTGFYYTSAVDRTGTANTVSLVRSAGSFVFIDSDSPGAPIAIGGNISPTAELTKVSLFRIRETSAPSNPDSGGFLSIEIESPSLALDLTPVNLVFDGAPDYYPILGNANHQIVELPNGYQIQGGIANADLVEIFPTSDPGRIPDIGPQSLAEQIGWRDFEITLELDPTSARFPAENTLHYDAFFGARALFAGPQPYDDDYQTTQSAFILWEAYESANVQQQRPFAYCGTGGAIGEDATGLPSRITLRKINGTLESEVTGSPAFPPSFIDEMDPPLDPFLELRLLGIFGAHDNGTIPADAWKLRRIEIRTLPLGPLGAETWSIYD